MISTSKVYNLKLGPQLKTIILLASMKANSIIIMWLEMVAVAVWLEMAAVEQNK